MFLNREIIGGEVSALVLESMCCPLFKFDVGRYIQVKQHGKDLPKGHFFDRLYLLSFRCGWHNEKVYEQKIIAQASKNSICDSFHHFVKDTWTEKQLEKNVHIRRLDK